jgi:hypothetical protein
VADSLQGWISVHRQIVENEFYFSERFTKVQAWIDLLILASFKPYTFYIRGNQVKLKRGQLGYAITTLAERWKWNERTVNKYLELLSNRGMIHYRKTRITTIITIKNYDFYQSCTEQNTEQNTEQGKNRVQTYNNDNNDNNILKEGLGENPTVSKIPEIPEELKTETYHGTFYLQYLPSCFCDDQDFINKWKEWVTFLHDKGDPLNPVSARKQLEKLAACKNWKEVIDYSIEKNYKGLIYKEYGNGKDTRNKSSFESRINYRFDPEKYKRDEKELIERFGGGSKLS